MRLVVLVNTRFADLPSIKRLDQRPHFFKIRREQIDLLQRHLVNIIGPMINQSPQFIIFKDSQGYTLPSYLTPSLDELSHDLNQLCPTWTNLGSKSKSLYSYHSLLVMLITWSNRRDKNKAKELSSFPLRQI